MVRILHTKRCLLLCYSCRLLGSGPSSKCEKTFTLVKFKDWKHATGKGGVLSKHDVSCVHRKSVISWNQYKINSERKTSISDRLRTCRSQQIAQNRHYMKTLAEIILLCSHQEIALCGHIEDESGEFLRNTESCCKSRSCHKRSTQEWSNIHLLKYRILL